MIQGINVQHVLEELILKNLQLVKLVVKDVKTVAILILVIVVFLDIFHSKVDASNAMLNATNA